jgi:hypothetical protein
VFHIFSKELWGQKLWFICESNVPFLKELEDVKENLKKKIKEKELKFRKRQTPKKIFFFI